MSLDLDDQQRAQIRDLFEFLDVRKDKCIAPKLAHRLFRMLGFEIALDEMDPSEGLTLDDVLKEVGRAHIRTQREPTERLAQIDSLVTGSSVFVTTANLRRVVEGARPDALEAAGGRATDAELASLVDAMVFQHRAAVKHATLREFEEFLTVGCPRTLRLTQPFNVFANESEADLAAGPAIQQAEARCGSSASGISAGGLRRPSNTP
jgi:Ca2+-binding EF-hand superfamily protein